MTKLFRWWKDDVTAVNFVSAVDRWVEESGPQFVRFSGPDFLSRRIQLRNVTVSFETPRAIVFNADDVLWFATVETVVERVHFYDKADAELGNTLLDVSRFCYPGMELGIRWRSEGMLTLEM